MSEQDNSNPPDNTGNSSDSSSESGSETSSASSGAESNGEKQVVTQEELNAVKAAHDADKAALAETLAALELLKREKLSDQERAVVEAAEGVRQELAPKVQKLQETLEAYLEAEVNDIPEDKRDLVPNLPLEEKLAWVKDAKAKGLFGEPKSTSSTVIKPGHTPSGTTTVDRAALKGQALANHYEATYGIKPKTSFTY